MDEAVADPAPDRSKRARMRPGQGRMVGANIAVAGISVGLVSPCQRDHSAHLSALMTLPVGYAGRQLTTTSLDFSPVLSAGLLMR